MKLFWTARAVMLPRWLAVGTCLLGAMALGSCSGRQSDVSLGQAAPRAVSPPGAATGLPAAEVAQEREVEVSEGKPSAEAPAERPPAGRSEAVFASLRVAKEEPYVIFPGPASDYALFKATQIQLMKSRLVSVAALRKPGIAGLPALRRTAAGHDEADWLAGQLRVDFPGDGEIMRVGLAIGDAAAAAGLVNAVVGAYLEEAVDGERKRKERRLDELNNVYADKEEELRKDRNTARQLAEAAGTAQTPAGLVSRQLAVEDALEARRELTAARSDLRRARAEQRAAEIQAANTKNTDVPDCEVDALAQNDLLISQALIPQVAELKRQLLGADAPAAEKLTAQLKAVQGEIGTQRAELRRDQEERKRAAGEAELRRIESQVDVLTQVVSDCEQSGQRAEKKALQACQTSVEGDLARPGSRSWKRRSAPSPRSAKN